MLRICACVCAFLLLACCALPMAAQQSASASPNVTVPQVVNFSGLLNDGNKPLTGMVGVTFSLYKESQGGTPLWIETQNVHADKAGHYSVALGSTKSQGLPADIFASGEARWLGVQAQGQAEQSRVLLMSVPYALKALDAETIGGRPLSAFMLAPASGSSNPGPPSSLTNITGGGTAGFIPVFTGAHVIGNSKVFQTVGTNLGIGTTTPAAKLDVKGTSDIRDTLTLFPKLTHPALSVHGTAFALDNTGTVTFVAGQTFPGTGTVTSVGSGAGLTGGPITHSGTLSIASGGVTNTMLAHSSLTVTAGTGLTGGGSVALGSSTTLNLNTAQVPLLGAANSFTNNNSISVNSGSPALAIGNSSGDGIDIATGNIAVNVTSGSQGMHATTSGDAGVFEGGFDGSYNLGPSGGVYSESDTDSSFNTATYGFEFGSTTRTQGVWGFSASGGGVGVYGELVGGATTATPYNGTSAVYGDSSGSVGVNGISDANYGVVGVTADTSARNFAGGIFVNDTTTAGAAVLFSYGPNVGGLCTMDTSGNLSCTGTKSAVVPVDGGARKVALYAIEGPENWFEDAGSAHLSNGEAVVDVEQTFGQTINTDINYHVFLTPNGDCKGLYVAQKSATSFVVRELGGGTSNIAFDYRIMAKRKGYEQIRLADRTKLMNPPRIAFATKPTRPPSGQEIQEKHRRMALRTPAAQLKSFAIQKH
jgi:hypothetical protein